MLGSNVGDRRKHVSHAASQLSKLQGTKILGRSRIYETAPVGPGRRPYLNQAVKIRTTRTPMGMLLEAKRLECLAGRKPGPRWGSRPLDVDLIAYGSSRLRTPWLIVPHPRAASRAFVLAPLAEIAPSWRPRGRATTAALLRRLRPGPGIVKIYRHG